MVLIKVFHRQITSGDLLITRPGIRHRISGKSNERRLGPRLGDGDYNTEGPTRGE